MHRYKNKLALLAVTVCFSLTSALGGLVICDESGCYGALETAARHEAAPNAIHRDCDAHDLCDSASDDPLCSHVRLDFMQSIGLKHRLLVRSLFAQSLGRFRTDATAFATGDDARRAPPPQEYANAQLRELRTIVLIL